MEYTIVLLCLRVNIIIVTLSFPTTIRLVVGFFEFLKEYLQSAMELSFTKRL